MLLYVIIKEVVYHLNRHLKLGVIMAKKKGSLSGTKPVKFTLPSKVEESETMSIRLPVSLKSRIEEFADKNDIKASALVKHILEQFLDAQ